MLPTPFVVLCTPGMGFDALPPPVLFHHLDRAAYHFLSASVPDMLPVVISAEFMNDINPISIVLTLHAGLKDFGWKSEMLRQRRVEGWKRPLGVCMRIDGGAKG